jgi:hypothetical protein
MSQRTEIANGCYMRKLSSSADVQDGGNYDYDYAEKAMLC